MRDLSDIRVIESTLKKYGFDFSKKLGQNFLTDGQVCPQMAELACDGADVVIEIGPGIGVLTQQLALRAGRVIAYELDSRLIPVLAETLENFDNIEIVHEDFLKVDLAALIGDQLAGMRVAVCANLPYYITSPIIMGILSSRAPITRGVFMVQKEAGERLCAAPGTRAAGAVTIAVQYYAAAREVFSVPRTSFVPAPRVDSEVIELIPHRTPPVAVPDEAAFFRVVGAAFSQRRKTAVNCLSGGLGISKDAALAALERCGATGRTRAEALTLEQLAELTRVLNAGDAQEG